MGKLFYYITITFQLTCKILAHSESAPFLADVKDAKVSLDINDISPDSEWTVYDSKNFDKNELCEVLTCKPYEVCLTRNEDAACVDESKLHEIKGKKRFFDADVTAEDKVMVDEKLSKQDPKQKPMASHERHTDAMGSYQDCTDAELRAIKGRLYKWFSDIHGMQKSEPGYELPKHDVTCDQDVGFMFFMMDGDKSGKLGISELYSLDNDPHEKCVKSFLDRCDADSDDYLSLNEWCSCFQWSEDERHEPACHAALRKHDPHDPNSFSPVCDVEGFYELEQCHKGKCWCVDKWGREFDRSRVNGKANCQRFV